VGIGPRWTDPGGQTTASRSRAARRPSKRACTGVFLRTMVVSSPGASSTTKMVVDGDAAGGALTYSAEFVEVTRSRSFTFSRPLALSQRRVPRYGAGYARDGPERTRSPVGAQEQLGGG